MNVQADFQDASDPGEEILGFDLSPIGPAHSHDEWIRIAGRLLRSDGTLEPAPWLRWSDLANAFESRLRSCDGRSFPELEQERLKGRSKSELRAIQLASINSPCPPPAVLAEIAGDLKVLRDDWEQVRLAAFTQGRILSFVPGPGGRYEPFYPHWWKALTPPVSGMSARSTPIHERRAALDAPRFVFALDVPDDLLCNSECSAEVPLSAEVTDANANAIGRIETKSVKERGRPPGSTPYPRDDEWVKLGLKLIESGDATDHSQAARIVCERHWDEVEGSGHREGNNPKNPSSKERRIRGKIEKALGER